MKHLEKINSLENSRIVLAKKVRAGKIDDLIFVEGKRLCGEVFRSGTGVKECFVYEGFRDKEMIETALESSSRVTELKESIFRRIADTEHPQGIIVLANRPQTGVEVVEANLNKSSVVVFLNDVNIPVNLGAVIRTAEAAGVSGVILSKNSADVFSPKSLRAAMGSSFRMPIWEEAGFDEAVDWAKTNKLNIVASDATADKSYTDLDWTKPSLLLIGSEAHGLSESALRAADETVKILMESEIESLNMAVSAGIIMFEAKRQRAAN